MANQAQDAIPSRSATAPPIECLILSKYQHINRAPTLPTTDILFLLPTYIQVALRVTARVNPIVADCAIIEL